MKVNSFAERTGRIVLPNGITLLIMENTANPTVSISGTLKAGSYFNPSNKDGLSSLTASMLNKGTTTHSKLDIADALESVGARLGISSNTFTVTINGQSLSRDFPLIISTLAEELRQPTFPVEELDKLKQRVIAGIKEDQDETRVRAYERMTQLVFPKDNPFYRISAQESISQIESITVDDLSEFYKNKYAASSMILAIVGDIKHDEIVKLVSDNFGDWNGADSPAIDFPITPLQSAHKQDVVYMSDKANCDVVIGHASGLRRSNPDFIAARIGNNALGQSTLSSRLGLKVRDELGLTYGINSSFSESGIGDGPFTIGVTVAAENIKLAVDSTMDILNDYIEHGIKEDELKNEQSAFIGSFKVGLATNGGMAGQISAAELFGLGIQYLDNLPNQISSLTKPEVDEAIKKYIHPEAATTVTAGTVSKVESKDA